MTTRNFARRAKWVAATLIVGMVAAACGSDGGGTSESSGAPTTSPPVTETTDPDTKPVYGGDVTYGLEADTTGGWCLAEAQLAIAGIQVARALYDTLTAPDAEGNIKPYLAESVTGNADNTEFTIKLREGVTFHDGSPLDGEIVRDNILSWTGKYAGRAPVLFSFVFGPFIDTVEAPDATTVVVKTTQPWSAFPWFLWSSGRVGMMGREQLDGDDCNTNLVGTGPFMQDDSQWNIGDAYRAVRFENYWQKDEFDQQLPYLDSVTFKPVESGPDRLTGLKAGDLNMIHTSGAIQIVEIRDLVESGDLGATESQKFAELGYTMLNATPASPFNNIHARRALAYAIDRNLINEERSEGILTNATGPFAQGVVGYLEETNLPEADPAKVQEELEAYKADTGEGTLSFSLTHSADPETVKTAELIQSLAEAQGMEVSLQSIGDQSQYINEAIARNFDAILWRNHPGADPDTQYVWWHCSNEAPAACDNIVNFGGFNDPEINDLLERGRVESDPAARQAIYEDLNREFAKELYNLWGQYSLWMVAHDPKIHGVLGPNLPDGSAPNEGLATGHPVLGLWMEQ